MTFLKACWRWLSQSKNQKSLALIGAGAAAVLSGVWQVYLHISEKSKETTMASASNGGIAVVATGSVVTIGIPLEQYEAGLKRREQEVRNELSQASAAYEAKIALLEKRPNETQANRDNPEREQELRAELSQATAVNKVKITQLETQLSVTQAKRKNPESALEEVFALLKAIFPTPAKVEIIQRDQNFLRVTIDGLRGNVLSGHNYWERLEISLALTEPGTTWAIVEGYYAPGIGDLAPSISAYESMRKDYYSDLTRFATMTFNNIHTNLSVSLQ